MDENALELLQAIYLSRRVKGTLSRALSLSLSGFFEESERRGGRRIRS